MSHRGIWGSEETQLNWDSNKKSKRKISKLENLVNRHTNYSSKMRNNSNLKHT